MRKVAFILLLIATGVLPGVVSNAGAQRAPASLERISIAERNDGRGHVVRLHLDRPVEAFSEPVRNPDGTVEVGLYRTVRGRSFTAETPTGPVYHYQARESGDRVTVSIQMNEDRTIAAYRDQNGRDILINLGTLPGHPDAVASTLPDAVRPATGASGTTAHLDTPSTTLDSSLEEAASRWRIDTIVIDAGHGGKDPGAIGHRSVREKDIVLPIALKLGGYLEDLLGVRVVYTRSRDHFIELRERGRIANREGGDLFVSIHANLAANRQAHGTETFFLGMNKSSQAHSVIERENSVIQLEQDPTHYEQFDQAALVRLELAQSAFLRKSEELAGRVEAQFRDRVGRRSRGVKEGNLQVLWAAAMPAVLVEVGFISNPAEARFLRSSEGVTYMSSAIYRAIRDYKEDYERSLHLAERD